MNGLDAVLKNLSEFGTYLDAFCKDLVDRTQDDSVRLILFHIARWKRRIGLTIKCLTEVEKSEFEKIAVSPADLTFLSERVFADSFITSEAGKSDLLDKVIEVLDVLTTYYQWLLDKPLQGQVRSFFKKLLDEQVAEIEQLKALKLNAAL